MYAHCELQPTTEVVDHRAERITGRIEFRQPVSHIILCQVVPI